MPDRENTANLPEVKFVDDMISNCHELIENNQKFVSGRRSKKVWVKKSDMVKQDYLYWGEMDYEEYKNYQIYGYLNSTNKTNKEPLYNKSYVFRTNHN